ncbi:hypothetical protein COCNU_10G009160 [Cocos nucifera]|uniref:Uncharacterized protein n=1 Tax=Cocos nucifera TaxID=13894 RepID=A0A8K0N8P8_COCNU|nr:hypothetical protein COCNU_10G009160 [Cocos nucifera]
MKFGSSKKVELTYELVVKEVWTKEAGSLAEARSNFPRKLIIGMKFGSNEAELSFEAHNQVKFGASKGETKFSCGMKFGISEVELRSSSSE